MNIQNVWFVSPEHRENFIHLLTKFNAYNVPEYASAAYIVAQPEIHRRIDWETCSDPVSWYWGEWVGDDEDGYHEESPIVAQLSSAYAGLVRAAVEMYSSRAHRFDLVAWLGNVGDEMFKVFVQALEIRRDRLVVGVGAWSG